MRSSYIWENLGARPRRVMGKCELRQLRTSVKAHARHTRLNDGPSAELLWVSMETAAERHAYERLSHSGGCHIAADTGRFR